MKQGWKWSWNIVGGIIGSKRKRAASVRAAQSVPGTAALGRHEAIFRRYAYGRGRVVRLRGSTTRCQRQNTVTRYRWRIRRVEQRYE
jgi:hypothetical protein